MANISSLLSAFKVKIEEAVALVPTMLAEEKLKAVQFWNVVSEKLQEIVNNSAADISALAFEMEKQQDVSKNVPSEEILHQPVRQGGAVDNPPSALIRNNGDATASQPLGTPLVGESSHLSFQMDLPPPMESTVSETMNTVAVSSASSVPMSNSTAVPSLPAFTPSVNSPLASVPMPQSNSLLMMASTMSAGPDEMVLNDGSRPSRLQELLSRPLGAVNSSASGSSKSSPPGKNKRVKWDSTCDTWRGGRNEKSASSSMLNLKKQSSKIDNVADKSQTEPTFDDTLRQPLDGSTDNSEEADGDAVFRNIKVESIEDMNDDSQQIYKENGISEKNRILTTAKDFKANELHSGLEGDEDEDDEDEVEAEEEEDDGEDGCYEVDEDDVTGIGIDQITIQDGRKIYTCTYCQKTYGNVSAYKAHKYSHTKPYSCSECHARFTTRGNLIVHERRHTGEKPFGCPQCKAKFSTKGNLKRHIRSHSGERPWECRQCGGRFTEKKSLTVHMRRHTGERPYQCTICGKQFAQTGILQTHMAMHLDQREHLCEHCGKSFRQKSQLRLHMLRHQGIRKFNCEQCDAKFLTKGDLERHHRVHTGERPFVCELCGKNFTRQQSLNEHMNRHYGIKPYQCKYCGRGFAEMSACYKHIKHHEKLSKQTDDCLSTAPPTPKGSAANSRELLNNTSSDGSPSSEQLALVEDAASQKFTVLVRTEDPLDVGSEISVVQHEHNASALPHEPQITVAVSQNLGDFTAISLLANASTTFQENY